MKKILLIFNLCFLLCLPFQQTWAFDKNDLAKLRKTKQCSSGTFSSCDLENASLKGLDLSNADLKGANLKNATIENTNLAGANLEGADLTGAKLRLVNMQGAKLNEAIFNKALLVFVDFSEADLSETVFQLSTLKGIVLKKTKCDDMNFGGADLRLIDFSEATGINDKMCKKGSFGKCE
ncbi:pentapeptide repeat-containing protein [bacterium]|nr:pentapeptide repeat-containing protein [bacterium]